MTTYLRALGAALTISSCLAAEPPATMKKDTLNDILEPIRQKYDVPALAGVIFNADGPVEEGATGFRKRSDRTPVTGNDLWHLGSETKAMTATLTGTFVAEGKLSWDDKVSKYFPEWADKIDPKLRDATVSQFLSHRTGLTGNLPWENFTGHGNLRTQRRDAVKQLLTTAPEFPPGEFHYANAGYVVVGALLEKISGKTWEQLMTERIFQPLGMKSAGFGGVGTPGRLDQPWGHLEDGKAVSGNGPTVDNPAVMGPAGTVHVSAEDWSRFLTDQIRGVNGLKALLPPEIYAYIQSPHPDGSDYGLGWGVTSRSWAGERR